jgi:hypothetical protein
MTCCNDSMLDCSIGCKRRRCRHQRLITEEIKKLKVVCIIFGEEEAVTVFIYLVATHSCQPSWSASAKVFSNDPARADIREPNLPSGIDEVSREKSFIHRILAW